MTNTRNRPSVSEFYAYFGLSCDGSYKLPTFVNDLLLVGWHGYTKIIYLYPNDRHEFSDLADALESCRENTMTLTGVEQTSS